MKKDYLEEIRKNDKRINDEIKRINSKKSCLICKWCSCSHYGKELGGCDKYIK